MAKKQDKSTEALKEEAVQHVIYTEILPNFVNEMTQTLLLLEQDNEGAAPSSEWALIMSVFMFATALQMKKELQPAGMAMAKSFVAVVGLDWDQVKQTAFSMITSSDARFG